MQSHLKTIQWASITALALFVATLMASSYLFAVGVLISSFVIGVAYLIGISEFEAPSAHLGGGHGHATVTARD